MLPAYFEISPFDLSKWCNYSQELYSGASVAPVYWISTSSFRFLPKYYESIIFLRWCWSSRYFIWALNPATWFFITLAIIVFLSNDFLTASMICFFDFSIYESKIWSPFLQLDRKVWNVYKSAWVDYFISVYSYWVRSSLLSYNYWSWSSNLNKLMGTFLFVAVCFGWLASSLIINDFYI
mgnify:CR=1 FL=1